MTGNREAQENLGEIDILSDEEVLFLQESIDANLCLIRDSKNDVKIDFGAFILLSLKVLEDLGKSHLYLSFQNLEKGLQEATTRGEQLKIFGEFVSRNKGIFLRTSGLSGTIGILVNDALDPSFLTPGS